MHGKCPQSNAYLWTAISHQCQVDTSNGKFARENIPLSILITSKMLCNYFSSGGFFLNSFAIFKYFTKILLSSSNIISWIDAIFSIKRIFVVIEMDFPIVTPFKLFIRPTIHSMPRLFSINFVNCLNSIERSRFLYAFYWIQLGSSTLFEWKARSFSH